MNGYILFDLQRDQAGPRRLIEREDPDRIRE